MDPITVRIRDCNLSRVERMDEPVGEFPLQFRVQCLGGPAFEGVEGVRYGDSSDQVVLVCSLECCR